MVYAYNSQIEKIQRRKARAHAMLVAITVVLILILLTVLTFCLVLGIHFLSTDGGLLNRDTNFEQAFISNYEGVTSWMSKT